MNEHPPRIETIRLEVALEQTKRVLAATIGQLSPDEIAKATDPNINVRWTYIPDWERMDDIDIFALMGWEDTCMCEELLVVTEASFAKKVGAFRLAGRDLLRFIQMHFAEYGECFFSGDTVILDLRYGRSWLFHHEGAHLVISPSQSPADPHKSQ